jgi:hypothetical protein
VVESIERKISLPWLKREKDIHGAERVIVIRPGESTHLPATDADLAAGVFYPNADSFFKAVKLRRNIWSSWENDDLRPAEGWMSQAARRERREGGGASYALFPLVQN